MADQVHEASLLAIRGHGMMMYLLLLSPEPVKCQVT